MLHEHEGFVRLPHEQLIYTSPPRTSLSLQPLSSYKGKDALSIQSGSGQIYLTNQRVVYIPVQKSKDFQSFSAPLLHIHDTHVSAPFFGPNVWQALVQPVSGGGIPPSLPAVQLKVTFKEGGAFDYHNHFERIKERLQQAVELSQESSRGVRNVDISTIHLDELPAYSGPQHDSAGTVPSNQQPLPNPQDSHVTSASGSEPMEPPPGYEEVQHQSIANELEERLRRAS
ncbi:WW-domain ligand protein-domain-containing protein [Aspergillus leporis]|uniref:WW-domain ligand protein-domain-containing protein n=1 Tax=Aspergillus leporis TaxID=41062 RepID=A0A5N5X430_9EURO|nr:WW-domain ligand protein-domain-containing protein [Aspergillus leporis]